MKAISIRQPWAWLILHGGKDIENRTWKTNFRGRVLIHAAKGMKREEYEVSNKIALSINPRIVLPAFDELKRGGIIGHIEIIDCLQQDGSSWFTGPYGFKLIDPLPKPFLPLKGALGFFEVDQRILNPWDE
jgi:hypothetical protein